MPLAVRLRRWSGVPALSTSPWQLLFVASIDVSGNLGFSWTARVGLGCSKLGQEGRWAGEMAAWPRGAVWGPPCLYFCWNYPGKSDLQPWKQGGGSVTRLGSWVGWGRHEQHRVKSQTEAPVQGWINGKMVQRSQGVQSLQAPLQCQEFGGCGCTKGSPPSLLHPPAAPTKAWLIAALSTSMETHGWKYSI